MPLRVGVVTIANHVGVSDHMIEEGKHVNNLVLLLSLYLLPDHEGFRYVPLKELRVDGVDHLSVQSLIKSSLH